MNNEEVEKNLDIPVPNITDLNSLSSDDLETQNPSEEIPVRTSDSENTEEITEISGDEETLKKLALQYGIRNYKKDGPKHKLLTAKVLHSVSKNREKKP